MGLRADAIKVTGEGFDIERQIKESPVDKVILLALDGGGQKYSVLRQFTSGFIVRHSTFRNQPYVEIATDIDLSNDVMRTARLVLGNRIHLVEEGDVVPPDDDRFTWMIYGRATTQVYP